MNAKKSIAVVTGGAGFIGSHMVDLLVQHGFVVRVIDNMMGGREANLSHHSDKSSVVLERLDIRDLPPDTALFRGAKYVFHFAGIGDIVPSIERPTEYLDVNVQGTVRVLEAARYAGASKLVYAASSSCYGHAQVPTREDHPIDTRYPYALSKYLGELVALHWNKVYRLPVNSIRIFNAYGPRSRTSGVYGAVFGVFLRQRLARTPYTVVGDGSQRRDFIFASDVASAFLAAAESTHAGEIYNVGGGDPQSINRLVELLGGDRVELPKRPGEPDVTWADISKARAQLGWKPVVQFEEGVQRVLANIHYWRDAPLWDERSIADATAAWFKYLT
jgi:UDP-glucose 4-epimerase